MNRIVLKAICAFLPFCAFAQTNISGVVNSYHRITKVVTAKNAVLVDDTTGLAAEDKVMVIQMKGAMVNTTGSSLFGSVTDLNNAGNYELNYVCRVNKDSVFLTDSMVNTYTVDGKVQLVKIPRYLNAVVTGLLRPAPWDSTTGKGGVLAVSVISSLTLNAPVTADTSGFKGGKFLLSSGTCLSNIFTQYYNNPTGLNPQTGAYKGESVTTNLDINSSGGKGAAANGGGGGDNHNTGGGGGSNVNAGGTGGSNFSTFGCRTDHPGIGGYALASGGGAKIFLGGGGGAGHGNNTAQKGGGNGGGIVFIDANTLVSNGQIISANGQDGSATMGDGASGGGAGGTIIMAVVNFSGQPVITASGGKGGFVDNENIANRCFGDGGGGAGGVVYFTDASSAGTTVPGGDKGGKTRTDATCIASNSAAGADGSIVTGYQLIESVPAEFCQPEISLPVVLIYFKAGWKDGETSLEWKIAGTEDAYQFVVQRKSGKDGWMETEVINAGRQTDVYRTADKNVTGGHYQYRLKIIEIDGSVHYSPIRSITAGAGVNTLQIYPNPASQHIVIRGNFRPASVMSIYDVSGRLIFQKNMAGGNNVFQDVSFLKKGVYVLKIGEASAKLIISKK